MPISYRNSCLYAAALASLSLLILPHAVFCQQVTVSTVKNSYSLKEKITITVANPLETPVFTIAASSSPEMGLINLERKASVGWDALPLRCRQPSCKVDYTMPPAGEIKPGAAVTFSWQPKVFINNKYEAPGSGTYRLTIMYQVSKPDDPMKWNWKTVRSNTFTLE
jgi:hypothetical protein